MAGSLQDQLLGVGLVDKKKAKKISVQKRKHEKANRKNNTESVNEAELLAEKAIADEKEKSQLLNKERKLQAERKAITAQIKQLIEINRVEVDKEKADVAYNFVDAGKVKTIYITGILQDAIGVGRLAIVRLADHYELVPSEVAKKISERDKECVIELSGVDEKRATPVEDDPYSEYEIPDDLMW